MNRSNQISRGIDIFNLSVIALLFILTILNPDKISGVTKHALQLLLAGILYTVFMNVAKVIPNSGFRFCFRVMMVIGLCSYLFQAVAPLQHILHDRWLDGPLVDIERKIFGNETSVAMQGITSPALTEWMMFAYIIYIPLLPLMAFVCYYSGGRQAGVEYLLVISQGNTLCLIGFILFPLATQLHHMPEAYQDPLEGGIFTWCGEWLRQNQHYPGGALPSPHTTLSTIMLLHAHRYNRRVFYILLPIIFTIYIATVYGRYHYIWDSLCGILTGLIAGTLGNRFLNLIQQIEQKIKSLSTLRPQGWQAQRREL
jgi:membrane-associated phospholipid phosphatase